MICFGLIGKSLTHSFSGNYFTEKFLNEGISHEFSYVNFELTDIDQLPSLLLNKPDLRGFNVTIPYKESVITYIDEVSKDAADIGAVNTVFVKRNSTGAVESLSGFNTDHIGFLQSIRPLIKPHHKGALVLGTGGASKAIVHALNQVGINVLIVSRNIKTNGVISYSEISKQLLDDYTVVINTTPLGTWPDTNSAPDIPYHLLTSRHLMFDLVYNPAESKFLELGKQMGAAVKNGHEMLILQAEAAWKIWIDQLQANS